MKILFVGKKNLDYNRVDILYSGLKKLKGVEAFKFQLHKKNSLEASQLRETAIDAAFVYIPPFRPTDVKFVKKNCPNSIVIFDPLISDFMSKLYDHKQWWKAPFKYARDYFSFHKCDLLLTDTLEHKAYFSKTFNIHKDKIHALHIGTQTTPSVDITPAKNNIFKVGFYGRYQPLQGAEQIVKAAKLLQQENDIEFTLIGNFSVTPAYPLAKKIGLTNIHFEQEQPMQELFRSIQSFDVCLGVFGSSLKAESVIPNKVYHYASFGKGIITRDTPGIKEVFEHKTNIHLCDGSPQGIANSILELKEDRVGLKEMGDHARLLMEESYSPTKVATRFINILESFTS